MSELHASTQLEREFSRQMGLKVPALLSSHRPAPFSKGKGASFDVDQDLIDTAKLANSDGYNRAAREGIKLMVSPIGI